MALTTQIIKFLASPQGIALIEQGGEAAVALFKALHAVHTAETAAPPTPPAS